LAVFNDWAKQLAMPLEMEQFQMISQVHKSLNDFMARPSGALLDKENFVSLMTMSCDLNVINNTHLSHVLTSLGNDQAQPESEAPS
jgi:hypothetical protein